MTTIARVAVLAALGAAAAGCATSTSPPAVPGGDARRGAASIERYGCGSCHTISGIRGADGRIGPPLEHFRGRRFIAGEIPNTVDNAISWIVHPKRIEPGTIMPDLGVTPSQARDIVAYLYAH